MTAKRHRSLLIAAATATVTAFGAVAMWFALPGHGDESPADPTGAATRQSPQPPLEMPETPAISATPITVGPDSEFPPDTAMWVVLGPYGKGTGPFSLVRAYRLGDDPVQLEVLFPPSGVNQQGYPTGEGPVLTGIVADFDGAPFFASLCSGEGCGHEGGPQGRAATTRFYQSIDWGITWTEIAARDGEWWARGVAGNTVVAINFEGPEAQYLFLPQGGNLPLAQGSMPGYRAYNWYGTVAFEEQGGRRLFVPQSGLPLFEPQLPVSYVLGPVLPLSPLGPTLAALSAPAGQANGSEAAELPHQYVGVFDRSGGAPRSLFALPQATALASWGPQLEPGLMAASLSYARPACNARSTVEGSAPAFLDLNRGELSFLLEPFLQPTCAPGGSQEVIFAKRGPLARINTPGGCLNIRRIPSVSAEILGCAADGVIVPRGGSPTQADGHGWVAVDLPDGQSGFADISFLDLGSTP